MADASKHRWSGAIAVGAVWAVSAAWALAPMPSAAVQRVAEKPAESPWQAQVEHVLVLPGRTEALPGAEPGQAARELSALAWDPQARELVAVSDRGRLFRFRLAVRDGRLQADIAMSRRLERDPGAAPASGGLNAEALAWRDAPPGSSGELLVAGEQGSAVIRLAPDGRPLGLLPWPAAVAAALARAAEEGQRHGVEAIAWQSRHGLLAAVQRPTKPAGATSGAASATQRVHWIHASSGARWGFAASGPDGHLKAIEARSDGSLLLLERVRQRGDKRLHTVLRWLDPDSCGDTRLCAAPHLPVAPGSDRRRRQRRRPGLRRRWCLLAGERRWCRRSPAHTAVAIQASKALSPAGAPHLRIHATGGLIRSCQTFIEPALPGLRSWRRPSRWCFWPAAPARQRPWSTAASRSRASRRGRRLTLRSAAPRPQPLSA